MKEILDLLPSIGIALFLSVSLIAIGYVTAKELYEEGNKDKYYDEYLRGYEDCLNNYLRESEKT
jgi:uroporphyrinogen-III synthase